MSDSSSQYGSLIVTVSDDEVVLTPGVTRPLVRCDLAEAAGAHGQPCEAAGVWGGRKIMMNSW